MTAPNPTQAVRNALEHLAKIKADMQLIRDGLNKSIALIIHDELQLHRAIPQPEEKENGDGV